MTSRAVVMMTPDDKRAIEKRAQDHGFTPSEWIRRAAKEYEPVDESEAALLELLVREIDETVTSVRASVAEMKADLAFHQQQMARLRAGAVDEAA